MMIKLKIMAVPITTVPMMTLILPIIMMRVMLLLIMAKLLTILVSMEMFAIEYDFNVPFPLSNAHLLTPPMSPAVLPVPGVPGGA